MPIDLTIPIRLISLANARMHHHAEGRLSKRQRSTTYGHVAGALSRKSAAFTRYPFTVILTRIGKRKLDKDNLGNSFKHVQDGVADALGVNDGDDTKVLWDYRQDYGLDKEYAVRIQIYPFGAGCDSGAQTTRDPLQRPAPAPAVAERQDCGPVVKENQRNTPRRKSRPVSFWGDKA